MKRLREKFYGSRPKKLANCFATPAQRNLVTHPNDNALKLCPETHDRILNLVPKEYVYPLPVNIL